MKSWINAHLYVVVILFALLGWWLSGILNPLIVVAAAFAVLAVFAGIVRLRRDKTKKAPRQDNGQRLG